MEYIIYLFFFLAGAAAVFILFKSRTLKSYGTTKNEHSLDLITEHSDPITNLNETDDKLNLKKTEKELNNLHIVNELSQKVTSSLSLEESFRHMYTAINSMMDAAVLELEVRYGDDKDSLIFTNLNEPYESSDHKNHVSSWVFENKREIFLQDAANDYGRYVFEPMVLPNGHTAQSIMSFPITDGKGVIAILSVISYTKNSYEEFHQEMIRHLLPFIAVAIKNAYHHEELLVLKQRAERSEKFMQQFLANMSHEIRTPINAVMGMTQLLLDKNPHANQLKYLNSIRNASGNRNTTAIR